MTLRILKILAVILLALLLSAGVYIAFAGKDVLRVATGSVSRSLCAATFLSGLHPDEVYPRGAAPGKRHALARLGVALPRGSHAA